jgi:hypothetical protein
MICGVHLVYLLALFQDQERQRVEMEEVVLKEEIRERETRFR